MSLIKLIPTSLSIYWWFPAESAPTVIIIRWWFFYFHYSWVFLFVCILTKEQGSSLFFCLFNLCGLLGSYFSNRLQLIEYHYFDIQILSFGASGNPFKVASVSFWQDSIILFTLPYCDKLNNGPPKMSTSLTPCTRLDYLVGPV